MPGPTTVFAFSGRPVGRQVTGGDQLLDVAPRQAGHVGHESIDALAGGIVRNPQDARPGTRSARQSGAAVAVSHRIADGPVATAAAPRARPSAATISIRIAKLIAASATLNVYQRRLPIPASTKSTT